MLCGVLKNVNFRINNLVYFKQLIFEDVSRGGYFTKLVAEPSPVSQRLVALASDVHALSPNFYSSKSHLLQFFG